MFKIDSVNLNLIIPHSSDPNLQAWNAVDELFVRQFNPLDLNSNDKILIIHDNFGALSLSYSKNKAFIVTDSAFSKECIQNNALLNNRVVDDEQFLSFLDDWPETDYVFVQVPKSLDLLEMILDKLQKRKFSKIILGVMIKHMHNNFYKTISNYYETIESSKIVKKARLVTISNPINKKEFKGEISYEYDSLLFNNHKATFSSNRADFGSAFLLENLEDLPSDASILDIGCGNGLLSLVLAKKYPDSRIVGYDDSQFSVDSALHNAKKNKIANCEFVHSANADFLKGKQFDVIICNPPFHLGTNVTEMIADSMIYIARRALKEDGAFYVVCNRHLNYKRKLKNNFERVIQWVEGSKFKVFKASLGRK